MNDFLNYFSHKNTFGLRMKSMNHFVRKYKRVYIVNYTFSVYPTMHHNYDY